MCPVRSAEQLQDGDAPARRGRRVLWIFAGLILLFPLAGGGFYLWTLHRYYTDVPRPSRNFCAELNAPWQRVPEKERAWTHYRRIISEMEPLPEEWGREFAFPGSELWPEIRGYVARNEKGLSDLCETARMPVLGCPVTDGICPEYAAFTGLQQAAPATENPALSTTKTQAAILCRRLAVLLVADAYAAELQHDGARIQRDFLALVGMSQQIKEPEMSFADMFSLNILRHSILAFCSILSASPDMFSADQLQQLQDSLSRLGDDQLGVSLAGNWLAIQDHVDRCYTADGLLHYPSVGVQLTGWDRVAAPISARRAPSRSEVLQMQRAWLDADRECINAPFWQRTRGTHQKQIYQLAKLLDNAGLEAYPEVSLLEFATELSRQLRDSCIVALALERFRRVHSRYPADIEQLGSNLLRSIPPDRFSGQPIRYRLEGGKPVLYSVGFDRDDDLGSPSQDDPLGTELSAFAELLLSPESAEDGDWILWPIAKPEVPPDDTGAKPAERDCGAAFQWTTSRKAFSVHAA